MTTIDDLIANRPNEPALALLHDVRVQAELDGLDDREIGRLLIEFVSSELTVHDPGAVVAREAADRLRRR